MCMYRYYIKGYFNVMTKKTSKKGPLIMTERSAVSLAVCRDSGDTGGGLVVINWFICIEGGDTVVVAGVRQWRHWSCCYQLVYLYRGVRWWWRG